MSQYAATPRKLFMLFLRSAYHGRRHGWTEHGTSDTYKGMVEMIESIRQKTPESFQGDLEFHVAEYKLVHSFEPFTI